MKHIDLIFDFLGIRGIIAIGLALALGLALWRADSLSQQRDDAIEDFIDEQTRHALTRASLGVLQGELEAFVKAGELRKESRDRALEAVEVEASKLREQSKDFDIETVEDL